MYCNKDNVNILTALLRPDSNHPAAPRDAVLCPGSRNAPIIHNLTQIGLHVHPVTDERSAVFVAIGLALHGQRKRPVVVCITSGSALLNTLPGVAEAAVRHIPLLILSADRPPQWIGQLDGQTLPQTDALLPYARTFTLPEPHNEEERWWCRRVAREALAATLHDGGRVVHINIPISEPTFVLTTAKLPEVTPLQCFNSSTFTLPNELSCRLAEAKMPLLVIGEWDDAPLTEVIAADVLRSRLLIYAECLSHYPAPTDNAAIDALLYQEDDATSTFAPDLVLHIGGAMVDKKIKQLLRRNPQTQVWRIDPTHETPDTFCHLSVSIKAEPEQVLPNLIEALPAESDGIRRFRSTHLQPEPIVHRFDTLTAVFLGNSSAVRWGNHFFVASPHPIFGNRGTNGIEGSLSVAAGFALARQRKYSGEKVLCILGDLSFFYDANALWNTQLDGTLRILLVNNGGGGIFNHLPRLPESPAFDTYIRADHSATAEGIARSFNCHYEAHHSSSPNDLLTDVQAEILIQRLLAVESQRPVLFEVFGTFLLSPLSSLSNPS